MLTRMSLAVILALMSVSCWVAACEGPGIQPSRQPGLQAAQAIGGLETWEPNGFPAAPTIVSTNDALDELDALTCPEGVDEELWEELKQALGVALLSSSGAESSSRPDGHSMLCPYKLAAAPPIGDSNRVADLAMADHNDGSYTLTWRYRNLGDYGQDGKVGISDITPIAQHFGETYDIETESNSIQAVIDGSGNGKVDIADVTAIAQNFGTECTAYSVRRAASYPASIEDTTVLDTAPVEPEQWEERRAFSRDFALPPYTYIAVAPVDNDGTLGELSNVRYTPNHQPVAALFADPIEGDAPLTVNLDASESHDPDGPMAKYEWDWEGDGIWDEDTGTAPVVQHKYHLARIYDPAVRVTDGNGAQDVASITVTAGTWHIYDATDHTGYYTSLAVVNGYPAIAYIGLEAGERRLMYVRATDTLGTSWGTPVVISEDEYAYDCSLVSLAMVNGNPAIASYFYDDDSLRYVRADDADGGAWGGQQVIGSARCEPPFPNAGLTLRVVNGNPAVAYVDHDTKAIAFNRALDPDGAHWGSFVIVKAGDHRNSYPVMALVNGRPAICYQQGFWSFCYLRALDDDGASWASPSIFDSSYGLWAYHSLAEVQTHPAIAYYRVEDTGLSTLVFVRANDANGSTWAEPIVLDRSEDGFIYVGMRCSLASIGERPAVAYFTQYTSEYTSSLLYVEAKNPEGGEWREPVILETKFGDTGHCSLAEVDGHPAIAYLGLEGVSFAIYY